MSVLYQFFAGYFNQDWNADGAASWRDVIAQFVATNSRAKVLNVRHELGEWLSGAQPDANLPPEFGCDYHPRADEGLDDRAWVEQMIAHIDRQLRS